jgi:hypothetical protein
MRKYLALLIFIILPIQVLAGTGARFLTVEPGARPVGMGGAFTAVTADPYSAAYNPAAVFGAGSLSGSFGYNTYWDNTRIHTGYVIFEKKSIAFNAGIQFAEISDIEAYGSVPTDDPLYLFESQNVSFKGGASFKVHHRVALGLSGGWIVEKIDNFRDFALDGDFGVLVDAGRGINIGAAALYLGQKLKLGTEETDIPTAYRFGTSYRGPNYLVAADIVREDHENHIHFGVEYNLVESLFLRAGYRTNYNTRDFSAGVGFVYRNFRIDYAYLP